SGTSAFAPPRTTQRLCSHETENPVSNVGHGARHDCPSVGMNKEHDRERLLLAIYPTTRGFGFVVFEGQQRTIDWGVKDARGDKNRKVLAKIEQLVSWYRPDMLVLENAHGPGSRRAERIRQLHALVVELAKTQKIR